MYCAHDPPLNNSISHPSSPQKIDALLDSFSRFGVDLTLERMIRLLSRLDNPHKTVPIIHVAGTNGKGSVCAYLSSILVEAGYCVGRYTSPHLVDWTERICVNNQAIAPDELLAVLTQITQAIDASAPSPTQFEVITAAAWLHFAQKSVDVAVIEVGLGGRLDATNVRDRPLVSVITSISRDHWQQLGSTLADIAGEKAGVLKPHRPAVIGQMPPSAEAVIKARLEALQCPASWVDPAQIVDSGYAQVSLPPLSPRFDETSPSPSLLTYPLPLAGRHQLMNSAVAIATISMLRAQGWSVRDDAIQRGIHRTQWLGRLQWVLWRGCPLLIDGAHNAAAAVALRDYVDHSDRLSTPVHWVMGMLSTKDHGDIFSALLRGGDRLSLVPVPDHSSADPTQLRSIAQQICPSLNDCQTYANLFDALAIACQVHDDNTQPTKPAIILCGSLYLIGYFLKHHTAK